MSIYVDRKYLNLVSHRLKKFNEKMMISITFGVLFVAIVKRINRKQEVMFIVRRMIYFSNVIIVVLVRLWLILSKNLIVKSTLNTLWKNIVIVPMRKTINILL